MRRTIAAAQEYWDRYYSEKFVTGLGTENILAALRAVPPQRAWLDLGAGSESLLWSIPLRAECLIAVDLDSQRLRILRAYAAARHPRGAYQAALDLCDCTPADFAVRCRSLAVTLVADCLNGGPLPFTPSSVNLVTQFGLLGLTAHPADFLACWARAHIPLAPGGWCAGANWSSTVLGHGRVLLGEDLYAEAFASSGITPLLITRVPVTGDPDFDSVWLYLGRKP
jgi:SAM-dependent methyltransferase